MATTAIEWAEQTWNPTTGCTMICKRRFQATALSAGIAA
jgi:protein gp37